MKRYCFDTSGLSNPLDTIPEDIHTSIWRQVREFLESGQVAVTAEIYSELSLLPGQIGICIAQHKSELVLEVGNPSWNWQQYINHSNSLVAAYTRYIAEYNGGIRGTVGMNDISIIAMAKALNVPLVSMEVRVLSPGSMSQKKRKIPDICDLEGIAHLTFNEFLRKEGLLG